MHEKQIMNSKQFKTLTRQQIGPQSNTDVGSVPGRQEEINILFPGFSISPFLIIQRRAQNRIISIDAVHEIRQQLQKRLADLLRLTWK